MERLVHEYAYMGRPVARVIETSMPGRKKYREFTTDLEETDLREILREMPVEDKVHMKARAYGLHLALELFDVYEEDYLTDEDLAIHVLTSGFHNLTELSKDKRARQLVKDRGLERKLFSEDAILEEFPEIREEMGSI